MIYLVSTFIDSLQRISEMLARISASHLVICNNDWFCARRQSIPLNRNYRAFLHLCVNLDLRALHNHDVSIVLWVRRIRSSFKFLNIWFNFAAPQCNDGFNTRREHGPFSPQENVYWITWFNRFACFPTEGPRNYWPIWHFSSSRSAIW
jgi:hypothetical protein